MAKKKEIDALGHGIAYYACATMIESCCVGSFTIAVMVKDPASRWKFWRNTDPDAVEAMDRKEVALAVTYLDMRGLIERHPQDEDWVQVRDESEATA